MTDANTPLYPGMFHATRAVVKIYGGPQAERRALVPRISVNRRTLTVASSPEEAAERPGKRRKNSEDGEKGGAHFGSKSRQHN